MKDKIRLLLSSNCGELYNIHEAFHIIKFLYYSRLKHYIPIYCGNHDWRKVFWEEE